MKARSHGPNILPGFGLTMGYTIVYLSLIALIPLSTLVLKTTGMGWERFWHVVASPRVIATYRLSIGASLAGALLNSVFGMLVAWTLVRYRFFGRAIIDELVDLLGRDKAADQTAERERKDETEYAAGVLDNMISREDLMDDEDHLLAQDLLYAEDLADRFLERDTRDVTRHGAHDPAITDAGACSRRDRCNPRGEDDEDVAQRLEHRVDVEEAFDVGATQVQKLRHRGRS